MPVRKTTRPAKRQSRNRRPVGGRVSKRIAIDLRIVGTVAMEGSGELNLGELLGSFGGFTRNRNRGARQDE